MSKLGLLFSRQWKISSLVPHLLLPVQTRAAVPNLSCTRDWFCFLDRGWGMIQVHYSYYACYFYYNYISSTSDHQALDPRGWGPQDWTKVPPTYYYNCWGKNSVLAKTLNQPESFICPHPLPPTWDAGLSWNSASFDGMVVQGHLMPGKGGEGDGRMRVM